MSHDKNPSGDGGAKTVVLLHGTTTEHLGSILAHGLTDPCLTDSEDLAEYYAGEAAERDGGVPVVLEVTVETSALRYDGASMDEPVGFDDRTGEELERLVLRVLAKMQRLHPEWVRGGYIVVPPSCYGLSLRTVGSCRHEGTIAPGRVVVEAVGASMEQPTATARGAEEPIHADLLM